MKHRSKEGKREEEIRSLLAQAHAAYARARGSGKEIEHARIVTLTTELEEVEDTVHHYLCLWCRSEYSAESAHGFGFLSSWTRCDETGRPVRAETFGPRDQRKIGFCPTCAGEIEEDIDRE